MKSKTNKQLDTLKVMFLDLLRVHCDILEFHKTLTNDKKERLALNELLRKTRKSMEIVRNITHLEILVSLYNSFVGGKESYYTMLALNIYSPQTIRKWERNDKNFKEFLKLDAEARAKSQKEYEEKLKQQELIRQAQKEGKKIEFAYKDGKLQPIIVENQPN